MMPADTKKNKKLRWRALSIVAGFFIGFVFYFVSWFILMKGLSFPVEQFFHFTLNNLQFWTWLLLMVYIGEWVVYFFVSSKTRVVYLLFFSVIMALLYCILGLLLLQLDPYQKVLFCVTGLVLGSAMICLFIKRDKVWTLRWFIGHHLDRYLNDQYLNETGSSKLVKLRSKAEATKNSSAVLLSFSAVMISVYILVYLQHEPNLDSYKKVFLLLSGLALTGALLLLFISLEALDTAVNPLFDDLMLKNSLKSLYDRGTRYYLMGLAFFMFSLLCGLAIVNVFICFIGTIFFFVFFSFHNYRRIDDPNRV